MRNINVFKKLLQRFSKNYTYVKLLNGSTPIFSNFGSDILASDVVMQCISCIASEVSKLRPQHTKYSGYDTIPISDDLQKLLENPNRRMTSADFLEKICFMLLSTDNCYVIPIFDEFTNAITGETRRVYKALYPINPRLVELIEDNAGTEFLRFSFANGEQITMNYDDVIHIRMNFSANEFAGGDSAGRKNNTALLKILQVNETLVEGVANAVKASYGITGIVKTNTMLADEKRTKVADEFIDTIENNSRKIGVLDIQQEFQQLNTETKFVDKDTLEFIDKKICRSFKMCLPVLEADYTTSQYTAFYQTCIEPIVIRLSQAFTKSLFNGNQRSRGNKIQFYPKDLVFLDMQQTIEVMRILGDAGSVFENEKRQAFGLPPLAELEGVRMQSLNYVNANDARQYQIGQTQTGGEDGAETSQT